MISVIICTYNRCKHLERVLADLSIQSRDNSFDYEILIVDNNSNDGTRHVVDRFSAKFGNRLRYIFENEQGKSFALNTGIKQARGELLVFTDDDVLIGERWLLEIAKFFTSDMYLGGGGRVLSVWATNPPDWFYPEYAEGPIVNYDEGNQKREYSDGMKSPLGSNMFFKKEVFEKYGLFRTDLGIFGDLKIGGEEIELFERFRKTNVKMAYDPNIVVQHPVDACRISKRYLKRWYFNDGRSIARSNSAMISSNVTYLGVPRYLYRAFLEKALKYLFSLCSSHKKIFYSNLQARRILGTMYEYFIMCHKKIAK